MAKKANKAAMKKTYGNDWCHLCGVRTDSCVCIFYPDNAEHHPPAPAFPRHGVNYIRICADCGRRIISVAGE